MLKDVPYQFCRAGYYSFDRWGPFQSIYYACDNNYNNAKHPHSLSCFGLFSFVWHPSIGSNANGQTQGSTEPDRPLVLYQVHGYQHGTEPARSASDTIHVSGDELFVENGTHVDEQESLATVSVSAANYRHITSLIKFSAALSSAICLDNICCTWNNWTFRLKNNLHTMFSIKFKGLLIGPIPFCSDLSEL